MMSQKLSAGTEIVTKHLRHNDVMQSGLESVAYFTEFIRALCKLHGTFFLSRFDLKSKLSTIEISKLGIIKV